MMIIISAVVGGNVIDSPRQRRRALDDSDSDTDPEDDPRIELASSHSSDEDEEVDYNRPARTSRRRGGSGRRKDRSSSGKQSPRRMFKSRLIFLIIHCSHIVVRYATSQYLFLR